MKIFALLLVNNGWHMNIYHYHQNRFFLLLRALVPTLLLSGALLQGCAGGLISHVSRFHQFQQGIPAQSIAVLPQDAQRKNTLEFRAYANRLSERLTQAGFRVVDERDAQLLAIVNYGIDEGKTVTHSSPDYAWQPGEYISYTVSVNGARGPRSYRVTGYLPGHQLYSGQRLRSELLYSAFLSLDIVAPRARDGEADKLFEGQVATSSRHKLLPEIMPAMIDALFHEFPGVSGETARINTRVETPLKQMTVPTDSAPDMPEQ